MSFTETFGRNRRRTVRNRRTNNRRINRRNTRNTRTRQNPQPPRASTEEEPPPDIDSILNNNNTNEAVEVRRGYTLSRLIKKVLKLSPHQIISRASEDVYKAKIKQIMGERDPIFTVQSIFLPAPEYVDNSARAWHENISFKRWALANKTSFNITLPLYTFGRTDRGIEGYTSRLELERISSKERKAQLVYEIKKYYYGYLYALSAKEYILATVLKKLTDALKKTEDRYKKGKAKKTDLYRLRILKMRLKHQEAQLISGISATTAAFRSFLELRPNEKLRIKEDFIYEENVNILPYKTYLQLAFRYNYRYRKARYGLIARKAQLAYKKAASNPILFFTMNVDMRGKLFGPADISGVTDNSYQILPFFGIGIRWKTNFTKNKYLVAEADAEYRKLEGQVRLLKKAIPLQVKKAYLDLKTASKKLKFMSKAFLNGKKWMFHAFKMYMIGSASSTALSDGLTNYASTRNAYFNAMYQYNLAIANLSKIIGKELTGLRY